MLGTENTVIPTPALFCLATGDNNRSMSYAMGNEIIFITGDIYLYQRYKKCGVHSIHQLYLFSTLQLQIE
jgi:hypothetical protein